MTTTEIEKVKDDFVGPQHTEGKNPAIDEAVDKLNGVVQSLLEDDEAFKTFLKYRASMHNYSWLNTLLIYWDFQQRGHAGPMVCMGYKAWQTVGRKVIPGSKAIALFKPVLEYWRYYPKPGDRMTEDLWGKKGTDKEGKTYYLRSRAVGFEIIRKTFHIQDTDGPEYTLPACIELDDNSVEAGYAYDKLAEIAKTLGARSIILAALGDEGNGWYRREDRAICISSDITRAQQAKTLAHEIAHHICYELKLDHHEVYAKTRGMAETVAEGAAFVVMSHMGYDTQNYSAPYIAQWASDMNIVRMVLRDISKVAEIIKELPDKEPDVQST